MPQEEEDIQTFRDLGLTALQAKVYLALVNTGKSNVKTIAEKANIARQEAQRVATELGKIGLVEKILAYPTVFQPVPINFAIKFLLERREKEARVLAQRAKALLRSLANSQTEEANDGKSVRFAIINGRETIIRKAQMIVDGATKTCDVINGSWRNFSYGRNVFEDRTVKALKRNVRVRMVTQKFPTQQSNDAVLQVFPYQGFQLRFLKLPLPMDIAIYDKKELLVFTSSYERFGESPVLWTNSTALILPAQAYFNQLWRKAQKPRLAFSKQSSTYHLKSGTN